MVVEKCRICGVRDARYICSECGRPICHIDFDLTRWICIECRERLIRYEETGPYVAGSDVLKASLLIFLAFIIITFGFLLLFMNGLVGDTVTIIFPFIVTTDPILGLIIFVIFLVFMMLIFIYFLRGIG